jgi:hypothetical protein
MKFKDPRSKIQVPGKGNGNGINILELGTWNLGLLLI